jgi:DNA polymerase-1
VPCRSEHSLLNYLLSSAEAILCKMWLCDAADELERRGYRFGWDGDFVLMLWVHDEIQVAVKQGYGRRSWTLLVACAKRAGEKLGFRVPLASEYKTGRTWADACRR